MSILALLIQFVFRVTWGVAFAMAITPSRLVTTGFYRVHLWVLMGFNTLASLCIYTQWDELAGKLPSVPAVMGLGIGLAVASYVGAVLWLYERTGAGRNVLILVSACGWLAAALATPVPAAAGLATQLLAGLNGGTSGLVLGITLTAMFLGHWYLNHPSMELVPLRRLVLWMAGAVLLRMVLCGVGLTLHTLTSAPPNTVFWIFAVLRWLSGLVGALVMAWMTWQTLKIPNTQSATGILYAGVILTFIGELTSEFLSADTLYPI